MDRPFYSAAFFYNPLTQQLLLQQPDDSIDLSKTLILFGTQNLGEESPHETLHRHLLSELNLNLQPDSLNEVYDYFNPDAKQHHYIFWINFNKVKNEGYFLENTFKWAKLAELHKLKLTGRIKQDLVFFQREINAQLPSFKKPNPYQSKSPR